MMPKIQISTRGRPTSPGKSKPSRQGKPLALPLTKAQELFIERWMVRHNATRAYQDAYPNATYNTAHSEGSRLFNDPRISQQITRLLAEERKRLRHSATRVTDELAALAFSCLSDVYTKDGTIIAPADMPRDIAAAVKKVKRREIIGKDSDGNEAVIGHTVEIEMHDKTGPLRLLGTHYNLFAEQVKHSADEDLLQAIREGRARSLATS